MESQARMAYLQGDGFALTQKNQKAHPKDAQGSSCGAAGAQLDVGLRLYVRHLALRQAL